MNRDNPLQTPFDLNDITETGTYKVQDSRPLIREIVNGDGTSMSDFPKNPLQEKWDKLYPPSPMPQYSQVCDGYSCMWCGRCPSGEYWKVPEEDKEVWEQYQKEIHAYHVRYGNLPY